MPIKKPTKKTYRGTTLDVAFDSAVCTHAGVCVAGLPAVFDTARRPWILPDAADAQAVRDLVARCPSGALAIVEKGRAEPAATEASASAPRAAAAVASETEAVLVQVLPNGPLRIAGPVRVVDAEGTVLREASKMALCRCGLSAAKPFCDGAHAREGWTE